MSISSPHTSGSDGPPLVWVESMGGPLVVVPVSALTWWGGCTEGGVVIGDGDIPDSYDRACEVGDPAGVIAVGEGRGQALVLADQPARSCHLPEHRLFVRRPAADSESELLAAAEAVLVDPAVEWEECGTWRTDGPAVLMDSAEAGADLGVEYPDGGARFWWQYAAGAGQAAAAYCLYLHHLAQGESAAAHWWHRQTDDAQPPTEPPRPGTPPGPGT